MSQSHIWFAPRKDTGALTLYTVWHGVLSI